MASGEPFADSSRRFYVSPTYSTLLEGAKKARGEKSTARDFASRDGQDTVNLPGNRMTDIYFIEFDEEGRMSQPNAPPAWWWLPVPPGTARRRGQPRWWTANRAWQAAL